MIGLSLGVSEDEIIPASDVKAKIEAGGPADFDNCMIVGDLNLSALTFERPVHFNHTIFENSVNFESTIFNAIAYFGFSKFNDDAKFDSSEFNNTADFGRSEFSNTAHFGSSRFNGTAYFGYSKFNGTAYFGSSKFNGIGYFGSSKFNDDAYFERSEFNNTAYFGSSKFNDDANFDSSKFNSIAYFVATQFYREASFSDSQFIGTAFFNRSEFNEDARFEGADFNCKLYLKYAEYEKIYIKLSSIKELVYDDAVYLSLMENFKKLGYLEEYDNCYYEYRKERRDQSWSGKYRPMNPIEEEIRKCFDWGLELFYGYGKKPLYPLGWSLFIIAIFGIFWRREGLGTREWPPDSPSKKGGLWRKALIFSLTVFLSGTKFFIDPPNVPFLIGSSESRIKIAFTAERALGAFFSILFFLAIGATIIR